MTRIADPQLSFADLELRSQGVHLDPLLQGIAGFLDDRAALVEQVRQDLARGLQNPTRDGAASPPRRPCARSSSCASKTGTTHNIARPDWDSPQCFPSLNAGQLEEIALQIR